jgi:hypothetical protein
MCSFFIFNQQKNGGSLTHRSTQESKRNQQTEQNLPTAMEDKTVAEAVVEAG